jgi:UDP-2,3-diacylglucosamine pyrophosphatase LpxH
MVLCGLLLSAAVLAQPSAPRKIVVISDLHFGVGHEGEGKGWHPYEDFRWEKDFAGFLNYLQQDGKGEVDLILNGDSFELWQTMDTPAGCSSDKNRDLGCSEEEALKRFKRALSEHSAELKLLRAFAETGNNRVVFVPGNHDGALLFPKVQQALKELVGDKAVAVAPRGYWTSKDSKVLAEHGHQIGEDPNKMQGWPEPYITVDGVRYLRSSWGEQFVQQVYNQYEMKYPIIDNITEEATGVKYAIARERAVGAAQGVRRFLKFFLLGTSWGQFKGGLGGEDNKAPEWDFEKMRTAGDVMLVNLLPEDDPVRGLAQEALKEPGGLGNIIQDKKLMPDTTLQLLCDKRYSLELEAAEKANRAAVPVCPTKSMGATYEGLVKSRDAVIAGYLDETWTALKKAGVKKQFVTYVFSHTHRAQAMYPVQTNLLGEVKVINTGAWQRVVSPAWLKQKEKDGVQRAEMLEKISLEALPACYNFVRIIAGKEREPELMAWKQDAAGAWSAQPGNCH